MDRVVYTCVVGGIDPLQDPVPVEGVRYVCYTDAPTDSQIWEFRPLRKTFDCPRLTARYHKTVIGDELDADVYVWQDGKIRFTGDHSSLFDVEFGLIRHPHRKCIYSEGMRVVQLRKCDPIAVKRQMACYREEGCPADVGLYETAVMVRSPSQREMNAAWWEEIQKHTVRDQISLPYLIWKMKLDYTALDLRYEHNDMFKVSHHPVIDHYRRLKI